MLHIADKTFDSHLFTGTGKFASSQLMVESIRASGSQLVTLAMKRVDLRQHNDAILEPLIAAGVTLLPNTSGAPIGSNQGLETRAMLEIIIQQATVPVVVDAGIGVPSHAAQALEMGADAVLVNTAIAVADDPVNMAKAFRLAVEAGLLARQSGPGSRSHFAHATSPLTGFLEASA